MNNTMRNTTLVLGFAALGALAGCGGDSSSGAAAFAGTYAVSGTATAGAAPSEALQSVFVIDDVGNVVVDANTPNTFTGMISGNDISAIIPGSRLGSPGLPITCTGAVRVMAKAFNSEIREGSISSTSVVCNGVALDLGGEFSGPRVASTGFPGGREDRPMLSALRVAVQEAL